MPRVNNYDNRAPYFLLAATVASIDVFGDARNLTPSDNMLGGNPLYRQLSSELLPS
ncbi:MAG: hypothetical protein OXT74_07015 [Candidatus Poribacteria bacterium]|nr:hypothetical protein [Candidatus Poribacteria bacterium]